MRNPTIIINKIIAYLDTIKPIIIMGNEGQIDYADSLKQNLKQLQAVRWMDIPEMDSVKFEQASYLINKFDEVPDCKYFMDDVFAIWRGDENQTEIYA